MKIDELDFTVRTYNALKRGGINTVEELVNLSDDELMKIRNFGSRCLMEVHERLGRTSSSEPPTGCVCVSITNGDRIRAMSDEELAAWARKQIGCGFEFFPCGVVCEGKCNSFDDGTCRAKIMEWLQQPAEVAK